MKKYLVLALCGALAFAACSKDEGVGIQTKEDYTGKVNDNGIPTYADDYSAIANWDFHPQWNLANVHDPSVTYYNGYYYMFGTDASYGNEHDKASIGRHFQGKRSKDLVNWTHVYGPFNEAPTWVKDSLNSIRGRMNLEPIDNPVFGYWAPCVRVVDGKVRMYYSIIVDNFIKTGKANTAANFDGSWTERAFIGVCETSTPEDPDSWVDKGFVTCSSTKKAAGDFACANYGGDYGNAYFYFNAIDPTYIVDEGKHWLIYGSWHSGFAIMEIDPESGLPKAAFENGVFKGLGEPWGDNPNYGKRIATRVASGTWSHWQGSEAPEIVKKGDYYYLFMAYDGLDVPYNTRVCRAGNIEGPYYDIKGNNITEGNVAYPIVTHPYKFAGSDGWVGIAHCCIFQQEGTGDWFYASQGRLPAGVNGNASSNALMMGHVRRIVWAPAAADDLDNLWPLALPERYAGLSKKAVAASEIPGTYEVINLSYNQGVQDTSVEFVLASGNKVTKDEEEVGTWSFDEDSQYLTITSNGTAVVMVVEHEADWERTKEVTAEDGTTTQVMDRQETVVFAGTHKNVSATYWGKKIN